MARRKPLDVSFGAKRYSPRDTLDVGLPPEARRRTGKRDFSVKVPRNVAGSISAPEKTFVQTGVDALSRGLSVFGGGDEREQAQRASDIANAIGYVSDPFSSFEQTGRNAREQLEGGRPVTTQDYINLATPAVAELLGVAGSRLARSAPVQRLAGWLGETKPRLVDPDFIEGRFRVVPRSATPAASTSPTRPFISGPPSAPRLTPPKPFWERADEADRYLTGDAATAVNRFVGHEPGGVTGNTGLGWMIAGPLEEAYAAPSRVQTQLGQAFDPLREALRVDRGPAITLFRAQRPVTTDENVTYMARGEAPARNVLSWTDDPRVAEAFAGINPRLKPPSAYSEEDIQRLEDEYARTGKIDLGQYQIIREDTDYGPMNSIYGGQDNFITDTDSIRKYLEDQNEWANAYNAELAAKRENIVSADVPLEDIVWATNRLGQREFIVRNRPGSPYYIDETGKMALSVKPTESSLSVTKVPATPAEEGVDLAGREPMPDVDSMTVKPFWQEGYISDRAEREANLSRFQPRLTGEGVPQMFFHGAPNYSDEDPLGKFSVFDRMAVPRLRSNRRPGMDQVGSWFSNLPDKEGAEMYAGTGGMIYPVYLSYTNPWETSFEDFLKTGNALSNRVYDRTNRPGSFDPEPLRVWLKDQGYDAIQFPAGGVEGAQAPVVVLEPTQIKSAIGNRGTFDPKDPDIRKARGGHIQSLSVR